MLTIIARSLRSCASSTGLVLALAAGLLSASSAHAQFVLTSSLGNTYNVGPSTNPTLWVAAPFATDAIHTTITSVTFDILSNSGTDSVRIFSNVSSKPGVDMGLVFSTSSATGLVTFSVISGSALAANTQYWAVISGTPGFGNVRASNTSTGTGPGFISSETLQTYNSGSSWNILGMGAAYAIFQVTATAVPEPSTFAVLAGLGALGFAACRRRLRAA